MLTLYKRRMPKMVTLRFGIISIVYELYDKAEEETASGVPNHI